MAQVTGFLVKQTEKPTRNGGKIYSICVEVDGQDEWFGFGFDAPTFGVDSEIEFDVEAKGEYENVINDSVVIIENVNPPAAPARKPRGGGRGAPAKPARKPRGGGDDKPARKPRGSTAPADDKPARAAKKPDVDWDRKDRLIRAQSCQNTAVATIALAQAAGTLELPKKKALQWDSLQALIEKESLRLFLKYDEVADECHDYGQGDGSAVGDGSDYDDDGGIPE